MRELRNLRINLGSGKWSLDGWFNVDIAINPRAKRPPDLVSDVRKIDLPDGCAVEIMAIHLWEHIQRWECDAVIAEWKRLLLPGGLLVLEMPDLLKCCRNILEGRRGKGHEDQLGLWGLYGDPTQLDPLMMHCWGWTFATLAPFLDRHGFKNISEEETQWHANGKGVRDFRITARKGMH